MPAVSSKMAAGDASARSFIPGLLELFAVPDQRRIVELECRRFHIAGRARNVDLGAYLLDLRRKSMSAHTPAIGGQAELLQTILIRRSWTSLQPQRRPEASDSAELVADPGSRYLSQLETADRHGDAVPEAKVARLKDKIEKLKEEIVRLIGLPFAMSGLSKLAAYGPTQSRLRRAGSSATAFTCDTSASAADAEPAQPARSQGEPHVVV